MTQNNRRWTVMVYMAGDNGKVFEQLQGKRLMAPMEAQGYQDIAEMEAVGSTPDVAVLVQFDTLSDREHTYRIYIRPLEESRQIENIAEQNMGDPRALRDFIVWGIENYPAENYAVILWNHGTGWKEDDIYAFARSRGVQVQASEDEVRSLTRNHRRLSRAFFLSSITEVLQLEDEDSRAIAFDDSSLDFLDNAKLQQAFQEAEAITGKKVSLIGMDACLMGMVEVAYQLRTNANYMVASQEVEPLTGYPYTAILQNLTAHPEMTSAALAKLIVREYGRYYEGEWRGSVAQITQSATNLRVVEKLAEVLERLAAVLRQLIAESDIYTENALFHAQRKAVRFDDKDFVDLYDFLKVLRDKYAGDSDELTKVIDEVMDLMIIEVEPQLILANVTSGVRFERVKGLSIYSPVRGYSQFYERSDFAGCGWGEFLQLLNK
ncbi:clostripain-related cysteine peptidase [Tolypothrix sp. VBCCA 56010]|uniref:clostripain-related cysteine peptidase n=1 Tax=Tolypothrix sp. VBCCA 56010 TaxID=3137731 RepID=UPI003D7C572B